MTYVCKTHGERLTVRKASDGWPIIEYRHPGMYQVRHCHLVANFRAIVASGEDPCGAHAVFYRRHGEPVHQTCEITAEEG